MLLTRCHGIGWSSRLCHAKPAGLSLVQAQWLKIPNYFVEVNALD